MSGKRILNMVFIKYADANNKRLSNPSVVNMEEFRIWKNALATIIDENVQKIIDTNLLVALICEGLIVNNELRTLKPLYDFIRDRLGGEVCYVNGNEVSKKTFEGRIRSCMYEHSSDSRQHYFRNGELQPIGWRINIFNNDRLYERNNEAQWMPYVRVTGYMWRFGKGSERPTNEVLMEADNLYRVKGVRRGKGCINDNQLYSHN